MVCKILGIKNIIDKNAELREHSGQLKSAIYDYIVAATVREPEVLAKLRQEMADYPDGDMQISPDQGQFMALLVQILGAKKILEIGTFTGYSSLWMAIALPDDGCLITCDVSEEYTAIAQKYWQLADVSSKVTPHIAPALDTLDRLIENGESETFDFIFIDADKTEYDDYYEKSLQLLRAGGLIAIDNALWQGFVADPAIQDRATVAIRHLNQKVCQDRRVTMSLVTISDGLLLVCKRKQDSPQ